MEIIKKLGFTQAPWWCSGNEVGTAPMMMVKICKVHQTAMGDKDESRANGRLIASAPDLLNDLIKDIQKLEFIYVADVNDPTHVEAFECEAGSKLNLLLKITGMTWEQVKEVIQ